MQKMRVWMRIAGGGTILAQPTPTLDFAPPSRRFIRVQRMFGMKVSRGFALFSALDMDSGMIGQFAPVILQYLGQQGVGSSLLQNISSIWRGGSDV